MMNSEVMSIEDIVKLLNGIGDLSVRTWFGIVESFAVDVRFGTSFIDRRIPGIFRTRRNIVS